MAFDVEVGEGDAGSGDGGGGPVVRGRTVGSGHFLWGGCGVCGVSALVIIRKGNVGALRPNEMVVVDGICVLLVGE